MKKVLMLLGLSLILVGCSPKKEETKSSTSEVSTTESSKEKDYYFRINGATPEYIDGDSKIKLSGSGKPESTVTAHTDDNGKRANLSETKTDKEGNFEIIIDSPESVKPYYFKNDEKSLLIDMYSKSEFDKSEAQKELERKEIEQKAKLDAEKKEADIKKKQEEAEVKKTTEAEKTKQDSREIKAQENAKQYPADSVATFSGAKYIGLDYYYKGRVMSSINAQSIGNLTEKSFLVKNDHDYIMLVTPAYEVDIPNDAELEIFGHLNGNEYDYSPSGLTGINSKSSLINAYKILVNGKELGISYFGPEDI